MVEVTDDGFLADPMQWNVNIAREFSIEEGIVLTEKHFEVLYYLRLSHSKGEKISIRTLRNTSVVDLKSFYHLFKTNPLKKACKIAGLPKPDGCV